MSARQLHVLITGGAGFVGRHLAAALIAEGHTVRVLDNLSRSSATDLQRLAPGAELISGDIRDARL